MSVGKIIGGIVGTLAPTLASALGGPLAGMATAWIAKKVLGQEGATLQDVSKAIAEINDPAALERLKQAEQEFKLEMEKMGVDVFKLEVRDRESARDFGVKSGIGAWMQVVIGALIVGLFCYVVYTVLSGRFTITDPNLLVLAGTLIGYVSAKADQVVAFLFGSSQGSKDKTDAMSAQLASYVQGKK